MSTGERLLRLREAAERLGVSVRTIWRMIAAGEFPKPVKIGASARVPESELRLYLERKLRERR